jgi:hypothetical protein
MALEVATGTISITTGAVGTTFTVSGLSFQPKAIFFSWSGNTAAGQAEADSLFGAGFAVSTSSRCCVATQSDHSPTTSACDSIMRNNACVATLTITGATGGLADLDAITSDGFRIIVDDQFPAALIVGYVAWGGSDLTDVAIVSDVTADPGTADYDCGFALNTGADDKAVIFLGGPDSGVLNTSQGFGLFCMGLVAGDTPQQAVLSGTADDGKGTTVTVSYCRAGQCFGTSFDDGAGALGVSNIGEVTAWLSNGFRVTWTDSGAGAQLFALVMKGGRWEVGNALTSTGTSNQTESTTYTPKGLLLLSHGKAESAAGTPDAHDERIIGAAQSASSRWSASLMDKDNSANADVGIAFSDTAMYVNQSIAATIVQEGAMDLVSFDSTPGFTYVMDDADPSQAFFAYLSAADAPASGPFIKVMSETLTLNEQSLRYAFRPRDQSDVFAFTDTGISGARRGVVASETVSITDQFSNWARRVRLVDEAIDLTDGFVSWRRLARLAQDNLDLLDGSSRSVIGSGTVYGRVLSDTLSLTDGFVSWRRLVRLLTDNADLLDGFSKTLIGAGIVYARVMSDTTTLIDDTGQRWTLRTSRLTDTVGLSDAVIRALARIRILGEDIEFSDGAIRFLRAVRVPTDTIDLSDELIRAYFPDQIFTVAIVFGTRESFRLSTYDPLVFRAPEPALRFGGH